MTPRTLATRVVRRRGRPRQNLTPSPLATHRFSPCFLRTLWEKGHIPFAFHEAGMAYARLRRSALRLMDSPSLHTTGFDERLDGTRTWQEDPKQEKLFKLYMATEQHLCSWERERLQLLRRALEGHKPLEAAILKRLGETLYPVLEDLAHFFQNLNATGLMPFKE